MLRLYYFDWLLGRNWQLPTGTSSLRSHLHVNFLFGFPLEWWNFHVDAWDVWLNSIKETNSACWWVAIFIQIVTKDLRRAGFTPSIRSFNVLLKACAKRGRDFLDQHGKKPWVFFEKCFTWDIYATGMFRRMQTWCKTIIFRWTIRWKLWGNVFLLLLIFCLKKSTIETILWQVI